MSAEKLKQRIDKVINFIQEIYPEWDPDSLENTHIVYRNDRGYWRAVVPDSSTDLFVLLMPAWVAEILVSAFETGEIDLL